LKFLVVDDHALTRRGLRVALAALADEVVVLEAANVEQARDAIASHADIDLMLLDLGLPGAGGLSLLHQLRREHNLLPVIVVSATDDHDHVIKALNFGALGYVPKSSSVELTLQAIRLVLSGGTYIPQQALAASRNASGHTAADPQRIRGLTQRQRQTLTLMAQGKPNKTIATELNITEATVKSHVTEILRLLKVTNRTQAVILAGEADITGSGPPNESTN
jgi:DNA-binding NarL/FixJ family response regulator